MAVSNNTKKKRNATFAPYQAGEDVKNSLINLSSIQDYNPYYQNSYANELKSIYQKIKEAPDFNYSSENDAAYRKFADEYNALAALAIADNQAQAQNLTGGYGSSYADTVASQSLQALNESAENAKPQFLENAEAAYAANNDALKELYQAVSGASESELADYTSTAEAYNAALKAAQKEYGDTRDFDFDNQSQNRDFWAEQYANELENENRQKQLEFKKYDVYKQLAADKCADFRDKQNNKGMRNYLNKLVEQDKLTAYLAEQLYKQYKYTAPSRSSSGRSRSGKGGSSSNKSNNNKFDWYEHLNLNPNIIKDINLNNRAGSFDAAVQRINLYVQQGKIDKENKIDYIYYYRRALK
ncbi:MAG: hypothetical protein IJ927_06920 [Eubacterium sp.]|nr:hypothetical protein [Eubacterium sp.]